VGNIFSNKFVYINNEINFFEGVTKRLSFEHNYDSINVSYKEKEIIKNDGFYELRIKKNDDVFISIDSLKIICFYKGQIENKYIKINVNLWNEPKIKIIFPDESFCLNDSISKLKMSLVNGFNLSIEEPYTYPCDVKSFRYMIIREDSIIFNKIIRNNSSLFSEEIQSQNKKLKSKDIIIITDVEYICHINHKSSKPILLLYIE
jgi:hypothetical protein